MPQPALPPTLEAYYKKLRNPRRLKLRKGMTEASLARLFALVQAKWRQALQSSSINPDFADGDSIATGQLANSLRRKSVEGKDSGEVTVYTTARHYNFVDTGEYTNENPVSAQRIRIWIEARFGIPASTDPSTPVQTRADYDPIAYGRLVALITSAVRERIRQNFYRGLDLTRVIGETITTGQGQSVLLNLFDGYRSLYTMETLT